jgi:hypothetical protein
MSLPMLTPEAAPMSPNERSFGEGMEASLQMPYPAPPWAMYVEQGNYQQLGIVNPERAQTLDKDVILNQIKEKREVSRRARQGLEQRWAYYEDLYHRRIRNTSKQEWQADVVVPEVFDTIISYRSLAKVALFGSSRWMGVTDWDSRYKQPGFTRPFEKYMRYVAERGRLREAVIPAVHQGMLLGSACASTGIDQFIRTQPEIVMIPVTNDPQQAFMMAQMGMPTERPSLQSLQRPAAQIKHRWENIWCIFPDPYASYGGDMKYLIAEYECDREDLEERLAAGLYDSLEDIGEPARRTEEYQSRLRMYELNDDYRSTGSRKRDLVQEYIGNLHDAEGNIVAKNWCVTVVNERAIVRMFPNPRFDGKTGYTWHTPIPYDGRIWGIPAIETTAEMQEHLSEILNLSIDDVKYTVLGVWTLDDMNCEEPPEDTFNMEPGRVYRGRGNFLQKPSFTSQANNAQPLFNQLKMLGQKSSRVNEYVDGTPSSRGRPSATEVQTKTTVGTQYLETVFKGFDEGMVEPMLEEQKQLIGMYGDDLTDPNLEQVLAEWGGPQLLADPYQRMLMLSQPHKIRAQGLSLVLDREQSIMKKQQFVGMLVQTGQMQAKPQAVLTAIYDLAEALGEDPTRYGYADSPEEELAAMFGMQMAAQAGGAGQGSAGAGGVTSAPSPVPPGAAQPPPSPEALHNMPMASPV